MNESEAEREARHDSRGSRIGIVLLLTLLAAGLLGIWARFAPGDLGSLMPLLIGLGLAVVGGVVIFFAMLVSVAKEAGKRIQRANVNEAGKIALGLGWGFAALALAVVAATAGVFVLFFVTCVVGGEI